MKNSTGLQPERASGNSSDFKWGGRGGKLYLKRECKGFTLVELIVVIVILAILAAILVPGLLKWIDKAKEEQYALEVRSIAQAAQAEVAELYAKGEGMGSESNFIEFNDSNPNNPNAVRLSGIKELSGINDINVVNVYCHGTDNWNIKAIWIVYTSYDGKEINAVWNVNGLPGDGAEKFKDSFKDMLSGSEDGWLFAIK